MKFKGFLDKNLKYVHIALFVMALIMVILISVDSGTKGWNSYRNYSTDAGIGEISYELVDDSDAAVGKLKIYEFDITGSPDDSDSLSFFLVHCNSSVYINDKLIYETKASKDAKIGKTPGSYYAYVPLTREDKDARVKVVVEPVYKSSIDHEVEFSIDVATNLLHRHFRDDYWKVLLSFVSIILGVVFFVVSRLITQSARENYVGYLSFFAVLIGTWKLMDVRMIPELLDSDPKTLSYISLTMFYFLAPPFVMFAKRQIKTKHWFIFDIAFLFGTLTAFISLFCQLFNIVDFRQLLFLTHMSVGFSILSVVIVLILEWTKNRHDKKLNMVMAGFIICIIGSIADFIPFYVNGIPTEVPFTLLAFDIFIFIIGCVTIWDLNKRASTDYNTGLFNRSRCTDLISDPAVISKEQPAAFIMLDMNFLKRVNDNYGHAEGDRMIFAFANIINAEAPAGSFTGRYGGDEFIVVLYDNKVEKAEEVLEGIEAAVNNYNKGHDVKISYSAGYAVSSELDMCTMKDLFKLADSRMYEQKKVMHEKYGEK